ncbi:peptidase M16 [filamentous cyanobacterium CCP2]|nr:peptidase M16 [filamentous cyanobacterium CCP2]
MPSTYITQPTTLNAPTLHRLSNGLTIIAEQLPVEAVNLSLWLGIGSAIETDEINGMAHFLEHMIFKGTDRLESGEFEQRIEQRGAITNAATSQDYTNYYITTAPQDFAELAPLQMEVVLNAAIPDAAFERERLVVLEEIRRSEDSPRRRTYYRSMEAAFDRLPYRRQVLGPASVIENLSPQQMRDFHATWYRPQSITASVVGNLPVEELIEIVANGMASAQLGEAKSTEAYKPVFPVATPEPAFTTIRRYEYDDDTLQQARLEERGLVSGISVSNMTYAHQGLFYISAHLPAENLDTVEAAIIQHIQTIQTEPIAESEIERVRTIVANRYVFGNETPSDRASLYGYYQAVLGDLAPAFNYPAQIRAIDAAQLQTAAQQYLSPDSYRVVTLKP